MIRVDYKKDEHGNVATTWIKEEGKKHSCMGRLLFSDSDFEALRRMNTYIRFEEKH